MANNKKEGFNKVSIGELKQEELKHSSRNEIKKRIDIEDKEILEIGCGDGRLLKYIAENDHPKHITGVDSMLEDWWKTGESSGKNWKIIDGNAEMLPFSDATFDAVISISTFEHIHNIKQALSEIRRVLKPYGKFYTTFHAIWTSAAGHHFFSKHSEWWDRDHLALIPPWGHLYMSDKQMREHLCSRTEDNELIDEIMFFIYETKIINRHSRQHLLDSIMNCKMIVREYQEFVGFCRTSLLGDKGDFELTPDIVDKVVSAGYRAEDLGVIGMGICLEKYADIWC